VRAPAKRMDATGDGKGGWDVAEPRDKGVSRIVRLDRRPCQHPRRSTGATSSYRWLSSKRASPSRTFRNPTATEEQRIR